MGYKKVTAIFDGDKQQEYQSCLNKFPKYNIKILFADDIRDKDAVNKNAKTGITNKSGNIKEENKDEFIKLLNEINKYHLSGEELI